MIDPYAAAARDAFECLVTTQRAAIPRAGGLVPANQLAIRDLVYYGDTPAAEILDPLLGRRRDRQLRTIW